MTESLTASPVPPVLLPEREALPMSSPLHAMPDPNPSIWADPVSVSGTFRAVGSVMSVPAVMQSGVVTSGVLQFAPDGEATGVMSQAEADLADFYNAILDPLDWAPTPWKLESGKCSYPIATTWPDGTPAQLFCSLDLDHEGLHVPWDTAGNTMPLPPVEDVAEELVA